MNPATLGEVQDPVPIEASGPVPAAHRVLIVDDSPSVRRALRETLASMPAVGEILDAVDGLDALALLARQPADLVITDVNMPRLDGFKFIAAVRNNQRFKDLMVIMLSAHGESFDKVRGLTVGANDYVTKPFERGELQARVTVMLKMKELQAELQQKNAALERMNLQLERLANQDGLTHLPNRRYFFERLEVEFLRSRRLGTPLSLLIEWENPTGSMKDRAAQAMILRAEENGRLKPGYTVVEYTGGSTGISLALNCTAKGYKLQIVTSDAFSQDKLNQMKSFGAELIMVPCEGGVTTKKLILDMIEAANEISKSPNTYWTNQLYNEDSITGYYSLGEEIWNQTDGKVDVFFHSVGTEASLRDVAAILKSKNPKIKIVVVEPAESPVLSGGQPGPHKIEGVGIGYTPPALGTKSRR